MLQRTVSLTMRGLLAALLLLAAPPLQAQDAERHQLVDGISIYLGVVPIQVAQNEGDELNVPQKVYHKKHRYYVLFAMFDRESGRRIVAADIKARVSALGGLNFSEKALKPVHIEKLISFGNYFRMADPDVYRIQAKITLPGREKPVTATFTYRRPKD